MENKHALLIRCDGKVCIYTTCNIDEYEKKRFEEMLRRPDLLKISSLNRQILPTIVGSSEFHASQYDVLDKFIRRPYFRLEFLTSEAITAIMHIDKRSLRLLSNVGYTFLASSGRVHDRCVFNGRGRPYISIREVPNNCASSVSKVCNIELTNHVAEDIR